jgi:uncharacterized RDD family membrane protein YckC
MGKKPNRPPPRPAVPQSKPAPRNVEVVGFGKRLGAALIDWIVVAFFSYLVVMLLALAGALVGMFTPGGPLAPERLMILLAFLVGLGYFIYGWARGGATLGKNVLGLKVVRADGSNLGWGKAILRYIGYIVSGIVLSIGFLWINFDKLRQGWHDKFAGSYVVREMDVDYLKTGGKLVPENPGVQWIWIVLWAVVALLAPAALLGSLWMLGPAMSRSLMELLGR